MLQMLLTNKNQHQMSLANSSLLTYFFLTRMTIPQNWICFFKQIIFINKVRKLTNTVPTPLPLWKTHVHKLRTSFHCTYCSRRLARVCSSKWSLVWRPTRVGGFRQQMLPDRPPGFDLGWCKVPACTCRVKVISQSFYHAPFILVTYFSKII